jgi:DNA polymerase V
MSRRIFEILKQFVPDIEIYSIDEAFVFLSDLKIYEPLHIFLKKIRQTILKWTGIPVSIGAAKNKTLAKLATEIIKKHHIPEGVMVLTDQEQINNYLKTTPVEDIWGIGRRWTSMLYKNFVYTAWDFVQLSDYFIKKKMNIMALKTKQELLGLQALDFPQDFQSKKSVRRSRSFGKLIESFDDLHEAIANFADACASDLQKNNLIANTIIVYIRTDKYLKNLPQYYASIPVTLKTPTNSSRILINAAVDGLRKIYKKGFKYKKAGVIATGLEQAKNIQINLFDQFDQAKEIKLSSAIQNIRQKFGKKSLFFASQTGTGNWKARQHFLSPSYTTDWNQLPKVR